MYILISLVYLEKEKYMLDEILELFAMSGMNDQCINILYDNNIFDAYSYYINNYNYTIKKVDYYIGDFYILL